MPKLPKTKIEFVTLDDGRQAYMTQAEPREMRAWSDSSGDSEFPMDAEDEQAIFNTLRTHERVFELLETMGFVEPGKIEEARKMAKELR